MSNASSPTGRDRRIFVGTYTEPEGSTSEGVYVYRMDSSSGKLTFETVKNMINPSYLEVHPQSGFLYTVNEVQKFEGKSGGGVTALSIDSETFDSSLLNKQPSEGEDPCYISIDRTGRYALVANYTSGSLAMLPIGSDGRLGPASQVIRHSGASIHPVRQSSPHAHCILPDPTNRFVVAVDLGIDKLMIYRMDLAAGQLYEHAEANLQEGSGPRHLAFHPNGGTAYVICELNSTLIAYRYDPEAGTFEEMQSVRTLPPGYEGRNLCADLHITPDGKFLYASNRGHDSLVCFTIAAEDGQLTLQDPVPSGGREPRGFAIDPDGKFLLAANQNSNTIVTFLIDPAMGQLSRIEDEVEVPMPVCIKFAQG
ncbi:MAG TPA: lactonase family protein [Anaerolineales bacterium]|nr:lactonase family protein [Anaerolineales bacterium]